MHRLYEISNDEMLLNNRVRLDGRVHYHEQLKLAYVRSGSMEVTVGESTYRLGADDFIFIYPKQIHKFRSENGADEESLMFLLDPDVVPEFENVFYKFIPTTPYSDDKEFNRSLLPLLEAAVQMRTDVTDGAPRADIGADTEEDSACYDLVAARAAMVLVLRTLCNRFGLVPIENADDIMLSILEHCNSRYHGRISLESMERDLHLNGCYISTLFMRKLGMGFHDYINSLRIEDACRLLTMTSISVSQIAEEVGFGTSRTFNRVFLESYGMSPREYRSVFTSKQK